MSKPTALAHHECYQVRTGSGTGILCSGEISDFVFLQFTELAFALKPEVVAKYSVKLYCRFKDDIFAF